MNNKLAMKTFAVVALIGGLCVASWAGDIDGALKVAAELLAAFRRAHPHPRSEGEPLGIGGHERLGEEDQPRAFRGRLA